MKAVTFELHIDGRKGTTMDDVRINLTNFLQTTTSEEPFIATITCTLSSSPRKGSPKVEYQSMLTLRHLQPNAFIILSHLLQAKPGRFRRPCPNIYVNGLGLPVAMGYRSKQEMLKFDNAMYDMSAPKMTEQKGKHYARWLRHLVPMEDD
jgi:hypothetical protein